MSNFKQTTLHVASIHDSSGKPAFSILLIVPKKDITILIKKEPLSSGDNYYYSFLIGGTPNNGWEKPTNEVREQMTTGGREIVNFVIPTNINNKDGNNHAHLHIVKIHFSDKSLAKYFFHKGTIHFPGE